MPRVKKFETSTTVAGSRIGLNLIIMVSAAGEFYTSVDMRYSQAITSNFKYRHINVNDDKVRVRANTLDELEENLRSMLITYASPAVKEENVIRYSIGPHVSFALDSKGKIFPDAGYPDAHWPDNDGLYGDHHATNKAVGGYSISIGAKALVKTTTTFGTAENIGYSNFYGENGHHHGRTNPAERLNSWRSLELPKKSKEIPYSDDAAIFFYDMMMGIAKLSKMIQDNTFDDDKIMSMIQSKQKLLG